MPKSIDARCREEVVDLHRFFEGWFRGAVESTDENFSQLERSLGAQFTLISPDGRTSERASLVAGLRSAHGSHQSDDSDFRIWIENVTVRPLSAELILVTYEEWQEIEGSTTARLSTAVLQSRTGRTGQFEWLHVHETWLSR